MDIHQGTFSIEDEKLDQVLQLCQETIIKDQLQSEICRDNWESYYTYHAV